jgi:hypothetical protein
VCCWTRTRPPRATRHAHATHATHSTRTPRARPAHAPRTPRARPAHAPRTPRARPAHAGYAAHTALSAAVHGRFGCSGCAIARHMGAAIFNDGVPVGLGDGGAGACAHGSKDGKCRQPEPEPQQRQLGATSAGAREADAREGAAAEVGAAEEGGKGRRAAASVDHERLQAHCAQFSGVFAHQCERVVAALWPKLKRKNEKMGKVTLAKFESAVTKSSVCKRSPAKGSNVGARSEGRVAAAGGCRARGDCTIYSPISDLVVKGNLTLSSSSAAKSSTDTIPRVVHLMFGMKEDFGGKPFGLVHFLCIKSARVNMPEAEIFLYYRYEPKGKWWAKAKKLARPIQVDPILAISGKPILHVAHVADLLRLQALRDIGGIYMDMDVITVRPFWPLMRNHHFVLGQEGPNGVYGLCNAVMLSAPNSSFVRLWIDHYAQAYDPAIWSMHSVKLPSILSHLWPELSTQVHDRAFFYPLWDKLDHLFQGHGDDFPENIAMHLWESLSWDKYISKLSENYIKTVDNNFNNLVRRFLTD